MAEANTDAGQKDSEADMGVPLFRFDGVFLFPLPDHMLKGEDQLEKLKKLKHAKLNDDDVIICAYPKCGTHWLWEVLEMLRSGVIQYRNETKETRMFEFIFKEGIEAAPYPRIFNTHLPLRTFPTQVIEKKIKCVQVMRNPKDTCVSMFHHVRNAGPPANFEGTFAQFTENFLSGHLPYNAYYEYLLKWKDEAGEAKTQGLPTLELFYEDMKKDPVTSVQQIADFMGVKVTRKFIEDVAEACSFQKMKKADTEARTEKPLFQFWKEGSEGTFYRKGEVGDWKNWFTVAESERFDQIWNEKMKDSAISFTYSLK